MIRPPLPEPVQSEPPLAPQNAVTSALVTKEKPTDVSALSGEFWATLIVPRPLTIGAPCPWGASWNQGVTFKLPSISVSCW